MIMFKSLPLIFSNYLLTEFPNHAFKSNKDGSFPVHKAASGGDTKVMEKLLHSKGLLNRKCQNVLHVAAENGKSEMLSYLLKLDKVGRFINHKDKDGNTPLHLAAKRFHPRVVYILSRAKGRDMDLVNNKGLTALDMVEIYGETPSSFEEQLSWLALKYVDAPQSSLLTRKSVVQKERIGKKDKARKDKQNAEEDPDNKNNEGNRKLTKKLIEKEELENFKDRIDTLQVTATLVVTVTFAAGFTLPGGYYQDGPQIGLATLVRKQAFNVFVICNTAAMYSSMLAVVTLIWAQLRALQLSVVALKFALPVLGFALSMMCVAFVTGVFVVLKHLPWLSFVVLGLGSISSLVMLVLFIPLYNPSSIKNRVVRLFFSGPLLMLIFVSEQSNKKYA